MFPHAALHQIISSVSGSKAVKQIGQSPETSLRFEGDEESPDDVGAGGAPEKISWSSLKFEIRSGISCVGLDALLLTEERKASWY